MIRGRSQVRVLPGASSYYKVFGLSWVLRGAFFLPQEGRHSTERELGEGGMAQAVRAIYDQSLKKRGFPDPPPCTSGGGPSGGGWIRWAYTLMLEET